MRKLWCMLVTGEKLAILLWLVFLFCDIQSDRPVGILVDIVLLALNLYSWGYQRRRAAGEVMP